MRKIVLVFLLAQVLILVLGQPPNAEDTTLVRDQLQEAEDKYFSEYAEYMNAYFPTETFTIELQSQSSTTFMIPPKQGHSLRGMVYIENDEDTLLTTTLTQSGSILQSLNKAKLGILHCNISSHSNVDVTFHNHGVTKSVFFSYQLMTSTKKQHHVYSEQFKESISRFSEISDNVRSSQIINEANLRSLVVAATKMVGQQKTIYAYAVVETGILLGLWMGSLAMLRRVIKNGYVSIV